jgi:hypothetical protein
LGSASYNRKLAKKKGVRRDPNKMQPIVDFTTGIIIIIVFIKTIESID